MKRPSFSSRIADRKFSPGAFAALIAVLAGLGAAGPVRGIPLLCLSDSLLTVVDTVYARVGLSRLQTGFEKQWVDDDTFRLDLVEEILDDPWLLTDFADSLATLPTQPQALLEHLSPWLQTGLFREPMTPPPPLPDLLLSPDQASLPAPFFGLLNALDSAREDFSRFLNQFSPRERELLRYQATELWNPDEERTQCGKLDDEFPDSLVEKVSTDLVYTLAAKTDFRPLWRAFRVCTAAMERLALLDGTQFPEPAVYRTRHGDIVVGSTGDDVYGKERNPPLLILDPGGDDTFLNGLPRSVGTDPDHPFHFVLDLAGNDLYRGEGIWVGQGSAVLGVALLLDREGNDVYLGGPLSQGAGVFGCGLLWDQAGDDYYRGDYFCQGAGNFGQGILLDDAGDDTYQLEAWGQALGGTLGLGVLRDNGGDDHYLAGGAYRHRPLLPEDHQSFAQGFAMGYRDRAGGGLGLLLDENGNDFYDAEVYAQGTSYWYSLGVLLDGGGNDHYQATQYSQGAGIHLSCGLLVDYSGNDEHFSRHGPAMGEGHDYSVGMLVDCAGDDAYTVSGGLGVALTNSVGIFLELAGDDLYAYSEKLGVGAVRWSRDYAGSGLFMDLAGNDHYPDFSPAADGKSWTLGEYGLGLDLKLPEVKQETGSAETAADTVLTWELTAPLDSVFQVAVQWGVGENKTRVPRARKALVRRAAETVEYIRKEHLLDSTSPLLRRALTTLAKGAPETFAPLLVQALEDSSEDARIMALGLLGRPVFKDYAPHVVRRLAKTHDRELRAVLYCLGKMEAPQFAARLAPYLINPDEKMRLTAVRSLGKIHDPLVLPLILSRIDDSLFTVRSAVVSSVRPYDPALVWRALPEDAPALEKRLVLEHCLEKARREKRRWLAWRLSGNL